jgi:uncharacterized protein (DUF305 family)
MLPTPSTTTTSGLAGALAAWGGLAAAVVAPVPAAAAPGPAPAAASPAAAAPTAPADTSQTYTEADVAFMRGMIHHHAQAVVMARMAPDRVESPALRRLTARILNSQKTEIDLMQDWLRDRGEPAPEPAVLAEDGGGADGESAAGDGPPAPPGGWDEGPQMPGLLSDSQMERLHAARGATFDRLFLTWMIDHHEGAVTMVENLVGSPGAAREEAVFRLASGIRADQATEIDRMRTMLRELVLEGGTP